MCSVTIAVIFGLELDFGAALHFKYGEKRVPKVIRPFLTDNNSKSTSKLDFPFSLSWH